VPHFEVIGEIVNVEIIARAPSIRERARLIRQFGAGRWRKLEGEATVRLPGGAACRAEVDSHEAHGVGRRKMKIKRLLE
jgi:hypothetical protein